MISIAAALVTGLLAATAFPPWEQWGAAWIAWVPLLLVLMRNPPPTAFRLGCLAGAVFWLCSIFWLTEVTWGGWVLLSLYCSLFFGAFAALAAWLFQYGGMERFRFRLVYMALLPLVWAGLEFVRATLLTGFAWNPLGASQYNRIPVIQISAWTGVYGVSALVILINVAVALTLQRYIREGLRGRRAWHPELMLGFLVLVLAVTAGRQRLRRTEADDASTLRTAVIQPNIPQYAKWDDDFVDMIYERLDSLTRMAMGAGNPDLVIWPETAVPDYVRQSRRSYDLVRNLTAEGAPLLVGSMDIEWLDEGIPRYYNSSLLFDRSGQLRDSYDKQHLVLFGEYVPLQRYFPFLHAMTPIEASFDHGTRSGVMTVPDTNQSFAVLICFEDTVAKLARRAVRDGARLLVNQTNVAWFRESPAAWQHMTHSVFRAVENGVPVVRAANTGVSCRIDRHGRRSSQDTLSDADGNTFIKGFQIMEHTLPGPDAPLTFYTRFGDLFGWTGVVITGMLLLTAWRRGRGSVISPISPAPQNPPQQGE